MTFYIFVKKLSMLTISVVHQKGGVGKTTLALNLAHCLSQNSKVAIADTDVQGSISEIEDFIKNIDIVPVSSIDKLEIRGYDILIIDTPPYLTNQLHQIFLLSDFVLIPSKAGYLDALAVKSTLALYQTAKKEKKSLQGAIVLNMLIHNNKLNQEIKQMLESYDLPILKTTITQRVSFSRSPMTNGVFNTDDEKAKNEIVSLANEILDHLSF